MEKIEVDQKYNTEEKVSVIPDKKQDTLENDDWIKDTERVEFINIETPGLALKFVYGSTRNPQKYHLFHGGIYDLPKKVVKHLESCGTPIYTYAPDGQGKMVKTPKGFIPRFTLRSR